MATGNAYLKAGATVVFGSDPGDDVAWTTEGVTNGAGHQSAQYDLGDANVTARPDEYRVRFYIQLQAIIFVVGNTIDVYAKTSDSATLHLDNDDGTSDIALSDSNKLKNLMYVGSAIVDEVTAGIEFVMTATIRLPSQYVHFVLENNSGADLSLTASATKLELTPIYMQAQ